MDDVCIDLQRQEQAKQIGQIRRNLLLVQLLLSSLYLLLWIGFGWMNSLKASLETWLTQEWLLLFGFAAVFGGVYYLITLPLDFYSGYLLEHRFGLSNQNLKGWFTDQLKSLLIGAVLGGVVLQLIYALLRLSPGGWWLWMAGVMLLFGVVLSTLAPVLLFPLFYKIVPLGAEHAHLETRLLKLAERAGAGVRGVFTFDMSRRTKKANAALMGLGSTRRIVLGDTLISEFSPDEIETVLAHELAHHVHKDIPWLIAVDTMLTLAGFYLASLGMRFAVDLFSFSSVADVAALPVLALLLGLYGLVTMPLENGFSRWRERLADQFALEMTGDGAAYARALTRLANQNLGEVEPEPWVEFMLYSHPALGKRIAMAQAFSAQAEPVV